MNSSSSSSSALSLASSLAFPPVTSELCTRSSSSANTCEYRNCPAIIPLDYDYQTMAPCPHSKFANAMDALRYGTPVTSILRSGPSETPCDQISCNGQIGDYGSCNSLFGDPVPPPPPEAFFGCSFEMPSNLRCTALHQTSSEESDTCPLSRTTAKPSIVCSHLPRLFPQTPYSSNRNYKYPSIYNTPSNNQQICSPTSKSAEAERLPLISSSSTLGTSTSNGSIHDSLIPQLKQTEFMAKTNNKDDTLVSSSLLDSCFSEEIKPGRQLSNESYSSSEWFHPSIMDYPEFSKVPQLRPSSKNVMSIKRNEMPVTSPLAAMITGTSSSSEERAMQSTQILEKPTVCLDSLRSCDRPLSARITATPCPSSLNDTVILKPRNDNQSETQIPDNIAEKSSLCSTKISSPSHYLNTEIQLESNKLSPVILKDSVTVGGDFRLESTRLHKKTSFTIINDKGSITEMQNETPLTVGEESLPPPAKHYLKRKSLSSSQIKLPQLVFSNADLREDSSPRPSVQFDMSGKHTPSKLPTHKGILQHRDSVIPSYDRLAANVKQRRNSSLPSLLDESKFKSSRKSALGVLSQPSESLAPFLVNPTRSQKGLLKVFNNHEGLSRLPLYTNGGSMSNLVETAKRQTRRRSSSTSASRRSSLVTALDRRNSSLSTTTSEISLQQRKASIKKSLPNLSVTRRKSVFQSNLANAGSKASTTTTSNSSKLPVERPSRTRISKASPLSPIIGTPNKDDRTTKTAQQLKAAKPVEESSKISARSRPTSRPNSRLSSLAGSRATSRSNSPLKEFISQFTANDATKQTTDSRAPSLSTSRASTKPISMPNSRSSSRLEPNKQLIKTRSKSNLSLRSDHKGIDATPTGQQIATALNRRKSISPSPFPNAKLQMRRQSISPASRKIKSNKTSSRKPVQRRISPSRIPISKPMARSQSPPKRKDSSHTNFTRTSSMKTITPKPSTQKPVVSARKSSSSTSISEVNLSQRKLKTFTQKPTRDVQANKISTNNTKFKKREPIPATAKKATATAKRNETAKTSLQENTNQGNKTTKAKSNEATPITDIQKTSQASNKKSQKPTTNNKQTPPSGVAEFKRQSSVASLSRASPTLRTLNKKRSDSNLTKQMLQDKIRPTEAKSGPDSKGATIKEGQATNGINEETSTTSETNIAADAEKFPKDKLSKKQSKEQFANDGLPSGKDGAIDSPTVRLDKTQTLTSRQNTADKLETSNVKPMQKSPLPPTQPIEAEVSILNGGSAQGNHSALSNGSSLSEHNGAIAAGKARLMNGGDKQTDTVSARAISVMPEVDCESANLQNYPEGAASTDALDEHAEMLKEKLQQADIAEEPPIDFESDANKRRSPDGQGGSQVGSRERVGSTEFLEEKGTTDSIGAKESFRKRCCRSCSRICLPCCHWRCSLCCRRSKRTPSVLDEAEEPVLSATSSATTTNLEVIDEKLATTVAGTADAAGGPIKRRRCRCWPTWNCCKRKRSIASEEVADQSKMAAKMPTETTTKGPRKQTKCCLCLSKIFCCRAVNRIDPKTGDETEIKKCCFCIPCRCKATPKRPEVEAGSTVAWQDIERGQPQTTATGAAEGQPNLPKQSCCKRFCNFLMCCRKKKDKAAEGPTASGKTQPTEDSRRRLHIDLVEYNSKMKAAIPVLPLILAWFCVLCNVFVPGLGTLISGFFCVCVGIPRFSQYDSAKARLGSLIINILVAAAQLFCVLFCLVGWGWSIWWGTIMLKCARKLSKIRKVERLEREEEKRQAALAAAAAAAKAAEPEAAAKA